MLLPQLISLRYWQFTFLGWLPLPANYLGSQVPFGLPSPSPKQGDRCHAFGSDTFRPVATGQDGQPSPFSGGIHINTFAFGRSITIPSCPLFLPFLSRSFFIGSSYFLQMIAALFAAGLLLIAPANAFWRLPCSKPVLNSRVDPIINPGQPSAHSHTIMGSNGAPHCRKALA